MESAKNRLGRRLVIDMPCLRSPSSPAAREEARSVLCTMELPWEVAAVKTGTPLAPPGAVLKVEALLQLVAPVARAELLLHQAEAPVLVALPMPAAEPGAPAEVRRQWMAAQVPFKTWAHPKARSMPHPMTGVTNKLCGVLLLKAQE